MRSSHSFFVIFNPASGIKMEASEFTTLLQKLLQEKFPQYSYETLLLKKKVNLEQAIRKASKKYRHFVVCGGDGTVRAVIQHLVHHKNVALSIIPLGTFNHFAKALRIPVEPEAALTCIGSKCEIKVDTGDVNGVYFANNSNVGAYVDLAKNKEGLRKKIGRHPALFIAMIKALIRFPLIQIDALVEGKKLSRKSPIIFVGNNEYKLGKRNKGKRERLNDHRLHFLVTKKITRRRIIGLFFHFLFGTLARQKDFDEIITQKITLTSPQKKVSVSADGDVFDLKFPLHYAINSNSLVIRLPSVHA